MNKYMVFRSTVVGIAFVVCLQQITTLLIQFFYSEKWSSVSKSEGHYIMELPNITICNYNQIDTKIAATKGLNESGLETMIAGTALDKRWVDLLGNLSGKLTLQDIMFRTILINQKYVPVGLISMDMIPFDAGIIEQFGMQISNNSLMPVSKFIYRDLYSMYQAKSGKNYTQIATELAHKCWDSMATCQRGDMWFDCCSKSQQVITPMGVCTKLDTTQHHQYAVGPGAGFRLLYRLWTDRFMENIIDSYMESGLMVTVGYNENVTTDVSVSPGVKALVKLQKHQDRMGDAGDSFFPPPCTLAKATVNFGLTYNLRNCQNDCLYKASYDTCGCMIAMFPNDSLRCEPKQWLPCRTGPMTRVFVPSSPAEKEVAHNFQTCWDSCLQPCEQTRISASVTTTVFPSPHQVDKILEVFSLKVTPEYLGSNFIFLDIYFENFVSDVTIQYPIATLNSLVGLIGGQVGLWIGASFITLIDLCPVIYTMYKNKRVSSTKVEKVDLKTLATDPY